jgi:16S rRNA (guanine966-N2)-methyltransferase
MGIRIVGGRWKSHPLEAPPDGAVTRPTTNRVREAMASCVLSQFGLDLEGVSVLDAYAGSGALGLEFLSRGAGHLTSLDKDRKAAARVKRNVEVLGASRQEVSVLSCDASAFAQRSAKPGAPYALVLLDPPYAQDPAVCEKLVGDLDRTGALRETCVVVYERAEDRPGLLLEGFELAASKKFGTIAFDVMKRGGERGE